jgi:hypothetical protein
MPTTIRPALLTGAFVAALSALSVPDVANAGSAITYATDNCNGALPGYEGALRKRPLGILNEGTTNAFVSCGVSVDERQNAGINSAAIFLINRGTATQAITCTFIDGLPSEFSAINPDLPLPNYRPKAVAVLPGQVAAIQWTPGEFELDQFSIYGAFNCNLPPKTEISIAGVAWDAPAP